MFLEISIPLPLCKLVDDKPYILAKAQCSATPFLKIFRDLYTLMIILHVSVKEFGRINRLKLGSN
jgi:hypothetical protein